ncbi:succinate receptor 1-like [Petromyzon marinus]|uniref:succinate receptor 1-like n=1 Tax=Petromyzon marinus TaxID=7757 RepID=UPI003F6E9369
MASSNSTGLIDAQINDSAGSDICGKTVTLFDKYVHTAMYCLVLLVGLPGNVTAIWLYARSVRTWSSSAVFLFNLAVADLLYLLTLPMQIVYQANDSIWVFGSITCKLMRFLTYAQMYISILFLVYICLDRYVAIVHPLKWHRSPRHRVSLWMCVAGWTCILAQVSPLLSFVSVSQYPSSNNLRCHGFTDSADIATMFVYSLVLTILGFTLPHLVMLVCYLLCVRALRQERMQGRQISKEKSVKIIICALVLFSTCFVPYHILRNVKMYFTLYPPHPCDNQVIRVAYIITKDLCSLNSALNPMFYFVAGDNFRLRLTVAVKSCCTGGGNQVHPEQISSSIS